MNSSNTLVWKSAYSRATPRRLNYGNHKISFSIASLQAQICSSNHPKEKETLKLSKSSVNQKILQEINQSNRDNSTLKLTKKELKSIDS